VARDADRHPLHTYDSLGLISMAGTTARLALPYPTGTDRVADGDNAIQALAEGLDFAGVRVGTAAVPFGTVVSAVRKAIVQTFCTEVALSGSTTTVTYPVAFTSQIYFLSATLLNGAAAAPVVNGGTIGLTSVSLFFPGTSSPTVRVALLVIGI
jgi:hypothetical protein